jgi:hypothetical protein
MGFKRVKTSLLALSHTGSSYGQIKELRVEQGRKMEWRLRYRRNTGNEGGREMKIKNYNPWP